jgi:hypothetical protein
VSILNRRIPRRHLGEAALARIWTAAAAGGEPVADVHLAECAECAARYEALCAWLQTMRVEALAEADAAFSPDRLAAQHAHILRRLEAAERPARVIAFPKFAQPLSHRPSLAHRWITVAAAAGLVIGVALGQWMDLRHRFGPRPARTADAVVATSTPPPATPDMGIQTASAISDEAFLNELETSLSMHPSVAPLRALDTITPRSRDFDEPPR